MSAVNEWLALLGVHEGGVTTLAGRFFNQGRPVADYLAATLAELIRTGHLALGAVQLRAMVLPLTFMVSNLSQHWTTTMRWAAP